MYMNNEINVYDLEKQKKSQCALTWVCALNRSNTTFTFTYVQYHKYVLGRIGHQVLSTSRDWPLDQRNGFYLYLI